MLITNYIKKRKNMNKLNGMPCVYYFNLDKDLERKKFMETQFKEYHIPYERISQTRYTLDNAEEWANMFEDKNFILRMIENKMYDHLSASANFLTHIELMKWWMNNTHDEYLFVMEDDYDLSLIDYWHFSWKYLISNLPVDWEAFKLNDDHISSLRFFIHPVDKCSGFCGFGATLFKRIFVSKILSLYCKPNGQIKAAKKRSMKNYFVDTTFESYNVDTVFTRIGSVYTAPLITTEASFCKDFAEASSVDVFAPIQRACHQWWRNERDLFTLDDFFYYNKPNDNDMTMFIDRNQQV